MGWLLVLFDLPTDTKAERREAARFRKGLLDLGYLMLQYSAYARCAVSVESKKAHMARLKHIAPDTGNVQCFFITDTQWNKAVTVTHSYTKTQRQLDTKTKIGEQLQFW